MKKEKDNSRTLGRYGYIQSGNRYHWRINGEIKTDMGFKSKKQCDEWIEEKRNSLGFEYRVGYMVKFKSEQTHWYLVDKKGNEVKSF